MKTLKLGSLFDGLGGWQIAAVKANVKPVWSSEIEKFPLTLTKFRFPDTKQLGDITKINGAEIEPVDIVTMGSPCQNLSISGNRKGLKGEESCLFMEGVRIAREMRNATHGLYPRFLVWENVTGAFSTNKGMDFKSVLEEITEAEIPMPNSGKWAEAGLVRSGKCSVGWRTLDSQYWGVPQRRRRIFLVADYSRSRGGVVEEVLFKPESLPRDIAESQRKGQETSRDTGKIVNDTSGRAINKDSEDTITLFDTSHACDVVRVDKDICHTLPAHMGTGGNNVSLVLNDQGGKCMSVSRNVVSTLRANAHGHEPIVIKSDSFSSYSYTGVASTLKASGGCYGGGTENLCIQNHLHVRKLTPLECERLQGLPDNWTLINDKSCSDSARYKAIGNGMAQPCADFIIARIAKIERKTELNEKCKAQNNRTDNQSLVINDISDVGSYPPNELDPTIQRLNSWPYPKPPENYLYSEDFIKKLEEQFKALGDKLNGNMSKLLKDKTKRGGKKGKPLMNRSGQWYANKLKRFLQSNEYDKETLKLLGVIASRSREKHTSLNAEIKNAIVELECGIDGYKQLISKAAGE